MSTFSIITRRWNVTVYWDWISKKIRTSPLYRVSIVSADNLAMRGARTSVAIILIEFSRNILASAPIAISPEKEMTNSIFNEPTPMNSLSSTCNMNEAFPVNVVAADLRKIYYDWCTNVDPDMQRNGDACVLKQKLLFLVRIMFTHRENILAHYHQFKMSRYFKLKRLFWDKFHWKLFYGCLIYHFEKISIEDCFMVIINQNLRGHGLA